MLARSLKNKKPKNKGKKSLGLNQFRELSISQSPVREYRQLYWPSGTALTVAGTGVSYTAATGTFVTGSSAPAYGSLYFQLADLPQYSSFQTLYDTYRIKKARVNFIPRANVNNATGITQSTEFYIVNDYDDSSVLTTPVSILQYENCKIADPWKSISQEVVPREAVASGGSYINLASQWTDVANGSTAHYGVKWFFPLQNSSLTYTIVVELLFELRSTR